MPLVQHERHGGGRRRVGVPGALKLRRLSLELRQSDLAELAGISREQLARLELGRSEPTLRTARLLAGALGCDVDDIFPPE